MTRYAIIGSAFAGNQGAASMLEASLELLRRDDDRFTLLSVYPADDAAWNTHADVDVVDARPVRLVLSSALTALHRIAPPLRSLIVKIEPIVGAISSADVLLDQGGISFSDGRAKFLPFNVATMLPAIMAGVPIVKCAQAVGPFEERSNRMAARAVLPRVSRIVARGSKTLDHLEQLSLTNVEEGVDLAFAMTVTDTQRGDAIASLELAPRTPGRARIGVCPSEVVRRQVDGSSESTGVYVELMAALVRRLADEDHEVIVFSHSSRENTAKRHNNDLPLCRDLASIVGEHDGVTVVARAADARTLRALIGSCDVVVTSRFHAMISSLCESVPPVVLGWGHKYAEVLAEFDLEDSGVDAKTLHDVDRVVGLIAHVLDTAEARRSAIAAVLGDIRDRARRHRDVIDEAIASGG